jgi:hypothetical protein
VTSSSSIWIGVFARGIPVLDHTPVRKSIPGSQMKPITNFRGAVLRASGDRARAGPHGVAARRWSNSSAPSSSCSGPTRSRSRATVLTARSTSRRGPPPGRRRLQDRSTGSADAERSRVAGPRRGPPRRRRRGRADPHGDGRGRADPHGDASAPGSPAGRSVATPSTTSAKYVPSRPAVRMDGPGCPHVRDPPG